MANVARVEKAMCLADLGRYSEASRDYEDAIGVAEGLCDERQVAVNKNKLAILRRIEKRYPEALKLNREALEIFERLEASRDVAIVWNEIGIVHRQAGEDENAEDAYQEALTIHVQTGYTVGQASTLNELGNLYSVARRHEEAVGCYRQAAETFLRVQALADEGVTRANLADQLVSLKRYDDARVELERAIDCKKDFGHAAEPWKTFALLSRLERETGNEAAAEEAHTAAIQSYLAYRRDGGESQTSRGELIARDPSAARDRLQELPNPPARLRALIPALEAILAGSRDPALAADPNLAYDDAAELLLLIESLSQQA